MDFSFSEEHEAIRQVAREFTDKKILPRADEFDQAGKLDLDLVREMGEAGFLGVIVPEEYGGTGLDATSYIIIMEELGRGCAAHATVPAAHNSLFAHPTLLFGNEAQKKKYLPGISSGEKLAAFSITEPDAGSDAGAVQCQARLDGDAYVLNGNKVFVTNGECADYIIVLARSEKASGWRGLTAFFIEKTMPGFSTGTIEDKLGMRASPTTELIFQDCRVPVANVLGKPGKGFKVAMQALNSGRMSVAAHSVGIGSRALECAVKYAKERKQFGQPISSLQLVQAHLANMECRLRSARWLVYEAAWRKDQGLDYAHSAAVAKLVASEMATFVTHRAMQVHGGYGYLRAYEVERLYRDARAMELVEGTSEIQRLVIAREVLRQW
jgi:butyryl-CoA dehydrogenase